MIILHIITSTDVGGAEMTLLRLVNEFNKELEKLSKLINIDILYYEDLFNSESEDKLRKNDIKRKNII